ncbi:unnamed protein product [Eruca vesicaria subsp. sativa]|uniref:NAC domain-containing protein n=1 Tax=Eruca vesicaria subsp. sativa TaxID=29727 RepID=A0ABC8JR78_ERUVS|nr:unnamed protein product [Eruca vesicaria subsp. sativa]
MVSDGDLPNVAQLSLKAPVYPPGCRFLPTELGLVRVHLRNKVTMNNNGFITTLNVYTDEPWLLNHVNNNLFKRNEWYYFSPRNRTGVKSVNRTVPGTGEGEGGRWKRTSGQEAIMDKNNKVEGYKESFVYYKKVKGKEEKTGWVMTEYSLHEGVHDDLVLCYIRGKIEKKAELKQVPNRGGGNE